MSKHAARLSAMKARMKLPVICAPMFLVTGPDMVIIHGYLLLLRNPMRHGL